MHLTEDELRAYIDRELAAEKASQVKSHLAGCPDCSQRLEAVSARSNLVRARFDLLKPTSSDSRRSLQYAHSHILNYQKEPRISMFNKRTLVGALTVVLVLVVVFTMTPASAWANSFLGLFRVQKVTVISFDPSAIQRSKGALTNQQDVIKQILNDDLKVNEQGKVQEVSSAAEAAQKSGFTPRQLDQTGKLYVKPGMNAQLTIDQPRFQALLDAAGVNTQLPKEVNGKVATLDVPAAVVTTYGDCPAVADPTEAKESELGKCTVLTQLPSPTVNAPAELNVPKLGQAVFEFLGLPESQAAQLASNIDWASTLVLPIPTGEGITYQNYTVDGVPGTLFEMTGSSTNPRYAVIWTKDGMLYMLTGPGAKIDAQQALSSLH